MGTQKKVASFTTIAFLKLANNESPIKFFGRVLDNDPSPIKGYFENPLDIMNVGLYLLNYIYTNTYAFDFHDYVNDVQVIDTGRLNLAIAQELTTFLWFVKDNSCNATTNIVVDRENGQLKVHLLETPALYYDCKGNMADVEFSNEEILRAIEIMKKATDLASDKREIDHSDYFKVETIGGNGQTIFSSGVAKIPYSNRNAVERAILFVTNMRSSPVLHYKIALGMNVLECLFSDTSPGEINYKIAERVAFYHGTNYTERQSIFKFVKDAYTIRSKYFHGQPLSNAKTELIAISEQLDKMLREILTKIIEFDSAIFIDKKRGDYFNNMIFS